MRFKGSDFLQQNRLTEQHLLLVIERISHTVLTSSVGAILISTSMTSSLRMFISHDCIATERSFASRCRRLNDITILLARFASNKQTLALNSPSQRSEKQKAAQIATHFFCITSALFAPGFILNIFSISSLSTIAVSSAMSFQILLSNLPGAKG